MPKLDISTQLELQEEQEQEELDKTDKKVEYSLRVFKTDKEFNLYFVTDKVQAMRIADNIYQMGGYGWNLDNRREADVKGRNWKKGI